MHPPASDIDVVVADVGPLWDSLRGSRVFMTGGTGFVGSWLLDSLLRADERLGLGVRVTVLTRRVAEARGRWPGVDFHAGDVRDFAFPGGEFTHILHAATPSAEPPERVPHREMFDIALGGTRRALALARAVGASRFLLTSSGAVYGPQPANLERMPEEHVGGPDPTDIRLAYGEAKRAAEMCCALDAAEGLGAVIGRIFAISGPLLPLDAHFALGNFVRDARRGGPVRVAGDGTPVRTYLYAGDLAVWLWTLLLAGRPGRAYNVGSEGEFSIAETAAVVAKEFGVGVEVAGRPRDGEPRRRYVPNTRRAREELGLRETVSLAEAVSRMAAFGE